MTEELTKGWIRNNRTAVVRKFMYNPTTLAFGRSASYVEINSPFNSYPVISYVGGTSNSYSISLYMYDNPFTGAITSFIDYLYQFLPPENNTSVFVPPTMTIAQGHLVKKCVLEDLQVTVSRYNSEGNPLEATLTLTVRQVM